MAERLDEPGRILSEYAILDALKDAAAKMAAKRDGASRCWMELIRFGLEGGKIKPDLIKDAAAAGGTGHGGKSGEQLSSRGRHRPIVLRRERRPENAETASRDREAAGFQAGCPLNVIGRAGRRGVVRWRTGSAYSAVRQGRPGPVA